MQLKKCEYRNSENKCDCLINAINASKLVSALLRKYFFSTRINLDRTIARVSPLSKPTSNEAKLPDVVTREANNPVEKILEEERSSGASRGKRKYTHFTPEARARNAKYTAQCGNTAAVRNCAKWVCGGRNL